MTALWFPSPSLLLALIGGNSVHVISRFYFIEVADYTFYLFVALGGQSFYCKEFPKLFVKIKFVRLFFNTLSLFCTGLATLNVGLEVRPGEHLWALVIDSLQLINMALMDFIKSPYPRRISILYIHFGNVMASEHAITFQHMDLQLRWKPINAVTQKICPKSSNRCSSCL